MRDPATLVCYNVGSEPALLLNRGYTGHEHLAMFGLINMNGRLYDPVLGRFLNVDNFVQDPGNSQNLNRYSYCLNNPLIYKDEDGNFFFIPMLIGMAIGAAIHTTIHLITHDFTFKNWNWGQFISSIVAGGVGGALSPVLASYGIGGFIGGAITGAATGASAGLVSGIINGQSFGNIVLNSFQGAFIGAAIGGVIGGIDAKIKGQRWLDGRGVQATKRYITGSGETPEKNYYYDDTRLKEMGRVSDLKNENSNFEPNLNKHYFRRHFDGNLTVEGKAFVTPGENFYININKHEFFSTTKSFTFSFKLPSNIESISWGVTGSAIREQVHSIGTTLLGISVHPSSYLTISGQWRSWNGFLFW